MTLLILMSSSESLRSDVGARLAAGMQWTHLPLQLPDRTDPTRHDAWTKAVAATRVTDQSLIATAPLLSAGELRALRDLRPLTVWLKLPFDSGDPPSPGTLLIDGSAPPALIVSTVVAVFRLDRER